MENLSNGLYKNRLDLNHAKQQLPTYFLNVHIKATKMLKILLLTFLLYSEPTIEYSGAVELGAQGMRTQCLGHE